MALNNFDWTSILTKDSEMPQDITFVGMKKKIFSLNFENHKKLLIILFNCNKS